MPETHRNREEHAAYERVNQGTPEFGSVGFASQARGIASEVREALRLIAETQLPPVEYLRQHGLLELWREASNIAVDCVPYSSDSTDHLDELKRLTLETARHFERLASE